MADYNGTPVLELPDNPIAHIVLGKEEPPVWLIPDFILQGHFVCWAGDSNVGKSYTLYTMALALASGTSAFGGVVPAGEPKRILYYDEENNPQDAAEKIEYYLKNEPQRFEISAHGAKKARSLHSCRARADRILAVLIALAEVSKPG